MKTFNDIISHLKEELEKSIAHKKADCGLIMRFGDEEDFKHAECKMDKLSPEEITIYDEIKQIKSILNGTNYYGLVDLISEQDKQELENLLKTQEILKRQLFQARDIFISFKKVIEIVKDYKRHEFQEDVELSSYVWDLLNENLKKSRAEVSRLEELLDNQNKLIAVKTNIISSYLEVLLLAAYSGPETMAQFKDFAEFVLSKINKKSGHIKTL